MKLSLTPFFLSVLACAILWCLPSFAGAIDHTVYVSADTGRASLKGHLTYLEDKAGRLTVEEVANPSLEKEFKPIKGDLSKGYSSSAFWLKAQIATNEITKDRRIIEVGPWSLQNIDIFLTYDGIHFATKSGGYGIVHKYLDVDYRNPAFSFTLEPNKLYTLYIRLTSEQPINPRITIWHTALLSHNLIE